MPVYQPPHTLARWAKVTLLIFVGLLAIEAIVDLIEINRVDSALEGGSVDDLIPVDSIDETRSAIETISILAYLAAAGFFIAWIYRAYSNIVALGRTHLRRSQGWAIGAWFIPLVNLVYPKEIADDTWRGSDPDSAATFDDSWRKTKVPTFVHWWWAAFLLAGIVSYLSSRTINGWGGPGNVSGALNDLNRGLILDLISIGLYVIACVLAFKLINAISERQNARFANIGSPGPVTPPPVMPPPGASGQFGPPATASVPPPPMPPPAGDDFRPTPGS